MKKLVSSVIIFMFIFTLTACGGNSNDPIVGEWKIASISAMGQEFTVDEFADLGQDISSTKMEFKSNGKVILSVMDPSGSFTDGEGTWKAEDGKYIISIEGEDVEVTFDEKEQVVHMDVEGMDMGFTRA